MNTNEQYNMLHVHNYFCALMTSSHQRPSLERISLQHQQPPHSGARTLPIPWHERDLASEVAVIRAFAHSAAHATDRQVRHTDDQHDGLMQLSLAVRHNTTRLLPATCDKPLHDS